MTSRERSIIVKLRVAFVLSFVIAMPLIAQVEPSSSTTQDAPRLEEAATKASEPARKLRLITNAITQNYIPKYVDGSGSLSNSMIYEDMTGLIGIGTTSPTNALHVKITEGATNAPLKLETSGADSVTGLSLKNDVRNWLIRVDGTDGDKFKIYDANAAAYRLAIDDTGRVGIGTSAPLAKLHIYGDATSDSAVGFGPDPGNGPAVNMGYSGASLGRGSGFINVRPDASAVPPNPSLRLFTANVERMILTNTGWMGVGTSAPQQKLHVFANEDTATIIQVENTNAGSSAHAAFRTTSALSATSYVSHGNRQLTRFGISLAGWSEIVNFNGNGYIIGTTLNTPLVFGTYGAERMRIAGSGDVGIGTTTPLQKLHVVGNAMIENLDATSYVGLNLNPGTGGHGGGLYSMGTNYTVQPNTANDAGTLALMGYEPNGISLTASNAAGNIRMYTAGSGSGTERLRVTANGNVGIGTQTPAAKLHVVGDIIATGNITGLKVIGAVYQDVAEWVPATSDMTPGTVVVLNLDKNNEVMPSSRQYDTAVAGVVSAAPGIILGIEGESKEQIATTGRVKVRVDARTQPVRVGDLLVTSDMPGTAMRSEPMDINGRKFHQPGTIIGKALDPLEGGIGEVLVLLSMQ